MSAYVFNDIAKRKIFIRQSSINIGSDWLLPGQLETSGSIFCSFRDRVIDDWRPHRMVTEPSLVFSPLLLISVGCCGNIIQKHVNHFVLRTQTLVVQASHDPEAINAWFWALSSSPSSPSKSHLMKPTDIFTGKIIPGRGKAKDMAWNPWGKSPLNHKQ